MRADVQQILPLKAPEKPTGPWFARSGRNLGKLTHEELVAAGRLYGTLGYQALPRKRPKVKAIRPKTLEELCRPLEEALGLRPPTREPAPVTPDAVVPRTTPRPRATSRGNPSTATRNVSDANAPPSGPGPDPFTGCWHIADELPGVMADILAPRRPSRRDRILQAVADFENRRADRC